MLHHAVMGPIRYIGKVLTFAVRISLRWLDGWQIAIAAAAPGVGDYFKIINRSEMGSDLINYGVWALASLVVIRLICAPYFIWKEQEAEISRLRDDLAKPGKAISEHIQRIVAESRIDLAKLIRGMYLVLASRENDHASRYSSLRDEALILHASSSLEKNANEAMATYIGYLNSASDTKNENLRKDLMTVSAALNGRICEYLLGHITDESLERLPPLSIVAKMLP